MDVAAGIQTGAKCWMGDAGTTLAGSGNPGFMDGAAGTADSGASTSGDAEAASFRLSWNKSLAAMGELPGGAGMPGETLKLAGSATSDVAKKPFETLQPESKPLLSGTTPKVPRENTATADKTFVARKASPDGKRFSAPSDGMRAKRTMNLPADASATPTLRNESDALALPLPITDPAGQAVPLERNEATRQDVPVIAPGIIAPPANLIEKRSVHQGPKNIPQPQKLVNEAGISASEQDAEEVVSGAAHEEGSTHAAQAVFSDTRQVNSMSKDSTVIGPRTVVPRDETRLSAQSVPVEASRLDQAGASQADRPLERGGPKEITKLRDSVRERNTLKPANSIAGLAGAAILSPQQHAMASNIPDATIHAVLREMGIAVMTGDRMGALHGMSLDSSAAPRDDAFAALDAARTSPSASWIHAGVHHAEAGYLDPGLGWISVRADAVGGGVHAAVVPGSAEAAQALDGHLVGLNAYLAGQHQRATTVTMDAPQSGPDTAMNHGQGGGEGNANQQNSEQERRTLMGESMRGTGTTTQVRPEREAAGPGKPVSIGGSHISVLA